MRKILMLFTSLLLLSVQLFAQDRTVSGKVVDAKGVPIPGASVTIKGTQTGTTTDANGSFSLLLTKDAKALIVSSVGFTPQDISIGNKSVFSFTLVSTNSALDEVVVVGYSSVSKRTLTGAVSKIGAEAINNKPVTSFDQALTGKAAGVQVNTSSGLIGDPVIIRIRGAASISSGSQPLIVMDGVPLTQGDLGQLYNSANALADLNPNDIESVEVLKDASAAAIYGSRASGGVLLITTKKGKAGQSTITFDSYVGFNEASRKMRVLNATEYTTTINKMRSNAGLSDVAKYGDIDGDGQPDVVSTDWQDEVYRKGFVQNHQVSVSGGNNRTTYYASANYNDFENYIDINRQRRGSARLNLNSKVNDWFTVGINTQYSRTKSYGLGSGAGGALSGIPFGPLTMFPNIPVRGADGEYYTGNGGNTIAGNVPNPVAVQNLNYDNRDTKRYIASIFGEAQLLKGLKLKTQANIDYLSAFNDQFWNADVGDGQGAGIGQTVYSERNTWSWYTTLNYARTIGDHDFSILAGTEFTRSTSYYAYASGVDLKDPDFRIVNPSNYGTVSAENNIDGKDDGMASYFGGINYAFQNKYLATVNFRADAYSGFGRDNRFGYFPSGSVAWRLSEEKFMANQIRFLKDLKIRASYGITGNSNIGYFPSIATFAPSQYADLGAFTLSNPGNSKLKWERTGQFDVGIDATLWKNTNITIDYYNKNTKDLILSNPVLATLGFPGNSLLQNIGKIQNTGVELAISTPVISKKGFDWNVNFNIAWNKNKVKSTNSNNDDLFGGSSIARPGVDLGTFYLINWNGVNETNGLPTFLDINGNVKQYDQSKPTASRWTTLKDGNVTTGITATDRVVQKGKTPYPKFLGGLSQTLNYANFDLSLDLQYSFGFYVYDNTLQNLMGYTNNRNKSEYILDAWTTPGQKTNVPRLFYGDNQWSQSSTRWLEKGDFVRIRNLQLGYSLPKTITERFKISRLRFYVQAQNLYTFTGYKGMDPEANANGNTNIGLGVDTFRPYLPRTYTVGINLGL